jgi:hypothetical protein
MIEGLDEPLPLADLLAITADWERTNKRRCDLIDKDLSEEGLKAEEREELNHLQRLADLLVRLNDPYPLEELAGVIKKLKAEGKWRPST